MPLPAETVPNIALDEKMAGLFESEAPEINSLETPEYTPFHVVLDSGVADHVVTSTETPGYDIVESAGSRAGAYFVAADGKEFLIEDK